MISSNRIKKHLRNGISVAWNRLGVWLVFLLLFLILSVIGENFFTSSNLLNIMRQVCVNAVVALGATFVIFCGEIDLSQGAMAALFGCICAMLMKAGIGVLPAILISLALGMFVGAIMGSCVTYLKVPSFIVTLGMMYSLEGVVLLLTKSQPISGLPKSFMILGRGYVGFVPVPAIILVVTYFIGAVLIKFTIFGRSILAVGENQIATRLSGLNVSRIKIAVFALAGFFSAFGGVILASRLSSGQPSSGSDLSLQALAAVFIGNTGGAGNVLNTLAGVFIMGLISNGLNLMSVNASWQKIALGLIIIGAVTIDSLKNMQAGNTN